MVYADVGRLWDESAPGVFEAPLLLLREPLGAVPAGRAPRLLSVRFGAHENERERGCCASLPAQQVAPRRTAARQYGGAVPGRFRSRLFPIICASSSCAKASLVSQSAVVCSGTMGRP